MKSMKIKLFLILLAMGTFTACEDTFESPASPTGETIMQKLEADENYTILVAALKKTGLAANLNQINSGSFTFFAPTDAAMITGLSAADEAAALTLIQNLPVAAASGPTIGSIGQRLNYHMVTSKVKAADITGTQTFSTWATSTTGGLYLNVFRISLSKPGSDVLINGGTVVNGGTSATVTFPDAFDSVNGVVHGIDKFLSISNTIPSDILTYLGLSINYTLAPPVVSTISSPPANFDILRNTILRSGLAFTIQPNSTPAPDWTVFAPDDASMLAFLQGLSASVVDEASAITYVRNTLTIEAAADLIKYHVVSKRILTTDMPDQLTISTVLTGSSIKVDYTAPPAYKIKDGNDAVADPTITSLNQIRSNGVVHVINGVLRKN